MLRKGKGPEKNGTLGLPALFWIECQIEVQHLFSAPLRGLRFFP